jgi:gliding motility-associated lipoprotein GldH
MRQLVLITFVLIGLTACDPNRVLDDNQDFEEAFWHKDSIVSFTFEIPDVTKRYHIYTNIRNAQHYPFYNLYYRYSLIDSSNQVIVQKLQGIDLFDPKTGEPRGSGLGDLFDHRQLILEDYAFASTGTYSISFEQYMRRDSLPLILSMGARVEITE